MCEHKVTMYTPALSGPGRNAVVCVGGGAFISKNQSTLSLLQPTDPLYAPPPPRTAQGYELNVGDGVSVKVRPDSKGGRRRVGEGRRFE